MRTSPVRCQGVDHTVLPASTPHLPLPRSSPEGATTVACAPPGAKTLNSSQVTAIIAFITNATCEAIQSTGGFSL